MRSKLIQRTTALLAVFATGFGAISCGQSSSAAGGDTHLVGRAPTYYSTAYLWQSGNANNVAAIDKQSRTLQEFQLEPFKHVRTLNLPLNYADQGVLASASGGYYITTADSEYAILKTSGEVSKNPLELLGKIESVAFDPIGNFLVLTDEFKTMAMFEFDDAGNILNSRKVGSLLPPDRAILSGAILTGGRLVLALQDQTLVVADLHQTILSNTLQWVLTADFPITGAVDISWLAQIPSQPDTLMAIDDQRLLTINVTTKQIIDQLDLSKATIHTYSRDYHPHVISQTSEQSSQGLTAVNYPGPDGKFLQKTLRGSDKRVLETWLDPTQDLFTAAFDVALSYDDPYDGTGAYRAQDIYRFHLTDNQGVDKTEVRANANIIVTPAYVFLLYSSILGKAQRRTYGRNGTTLNTEGYNFPQLHN